MEEILSMDEAAARLKITRAALYEMTRSRSRARQIVPIPFIRIGKTRRFRASALQRWLEQLEDANRQPA
jgi:excisionase family DNA binding protein